VTARSIYIAMIIVAVFSPIGHSTTAKTACHPLLWPAESPVMNPSLSIPHDTMDELQTWSEKLLSKSPHPVAVLSSAGRTNIQDPALKASRRALEDADRAAVLAISYRLTNNPNYLNAAIDILSSWAKINRPTGNPIDETRLEGMIWAYDLIACDLSAPVKEKVLDWFERLRLKKMAWEFGEVTSDNNHRIHQLKMILLLDKILRHNIAWEKDLSTAEKIFHD